VLALFYEIRDCIIDIRSPLSMQGEGSTRKVEEDENPREKEAKDRAYIVFERYNQRREKFNELYSLRYRFMTLFGKDKAQYFEDIKTTISEIRVAANRLYHLWMESSDSLSEEEAERLYEKTLKFEKIFWWDIPEEDRIAKRVDKAVSEIEKICRNIIEKY
ncbi:MAG: hypothetical protein ACYSUL_05540, partial [Planctomycetota bacterium]